MKRQHPLFTGFSLLFTALLLAGLGLAIWRSGGMAFSPGPLSGVRAQATSLGGFQSHAEFEAQCSRCHKPLETTQDALCLSCHTSVGEQISQAEGAHGVLPDASQCRACHPDHQGRDLDMVQVAAAEFDHTLASFSLLRHPLDYAAAPMACGACHDGQRGYAAQPARCEACHADADATFIRQHRQEFGLGCMDCHDGQDTLARFDHAASRFPLQGKHAVLRCTQCHPAAAGKTGALQGGAGSPAAAGRNGAGIDRFRGADLDCAGCHAEPLTHQEMFGPDCAGCHTPAGWSPARLDGRPFDHETTGFSLARHAQESDGSPITCRDCHAARLDAAGAQACADCHSRGEARAAFLSEHTRQFGAACLDCHDGADRMHAFDHARVFPLDGAHAALDCERCHANHVFRGAPSACVQCHAEPAIHAGFFGLACQACHSTQAWTPAGLRLHAFPLDHGGQGGLQCRTCHTDSYVEYTCFGCHDHTPAGIDRSHAGLGLAPADLRQCSRCHPAGLQGDMRSLPVSP